MDVPLKVFVAVSDAGDAERMSLPGAQISTHEPKLLKEDLWSRKSVDPTLMAAGTKAGEKPHASELEFPDATTTTTPASTAAVTAVLIAACVPRPPKLMLEIAGLEAVVASQSNAS